MEFPYVNNSSLPDNDYLDGEWDYDWTEFLCDDGRDEVDADLEEPYEGLDGCTWCGNFVSDCICHDDDPMMSADAWEEMMLANTDFDAGDQIKVRYDSFASGSNGGKKRAIRARANGHLMLNSCWKRSNRGVRKQWARHHKFCKAFSKIA
jgi:hypothetical protein